MTDNKIKFLTVADSKTRSDERRAVETEFDTAEVSKNMNQFLEDLDSILKETPDQVGKFEFAEFEVYAEVSAGGAFKVLGTGITAGGKGGLKFVFRRSTT